MSCNDKIKFILPDGEQFELDSYIDEHHVRRFVRNTLIDVCFDLRVIDLNRIATVINKDSVKLKDVIIFWSMLGYSVCGMCDLSFMAPVTVITPEWVKDPYSEDEEDM